MDNKNLSSKKDVKDMLKRRGLNFKKGLGQNFLTDENVLLDIINAADIKESECVMEIGPGAGVLTRVLAQKASKVVTVELDREIIPLLEENTADFDNVTIINEDILKSDLLKLSKNHFKGRPFKVIANLPYYITTPIIMKLINSSAPVLDIVIMIQKEVAQRLCAEPGTKEYGAITLSVRYYADVEIVRDVPPEAFVPEPKVWSSVLKIKLLEAPRIALSNEKYMFDLIKASFSKRRKTFLNAIEGQSALGITKEQAKQALYEMGFSDNLRGETLSLVQFAQISEFFLGKIREKSR